MGRTMKFLLGTLAVGAVVVALMPGSSDAAGRRRPGYGNGRANDNFYIPKHDANGNEIVPAKTDVEAYARYLIIHKDKASGGRHRLNLADSGMSKSDFDGADTNKDAWLDLPEVKVYITKQLGAAAGGDDKPTPKRKK